jgi:hypothetical protein
MSEIYKTITFLVISFLICLFGQYLGSTFIDDFSSNFIGLLTTLLAINVASGSLIAGRLKEINLVTGHKFEKTKKELKRSIIIQLILICITFIVLLFKTSLLLSNILGHKTLILASNTVTVAIFLYYLDSIKDLALALFSLLDFDDKIK